MYFLFGMARLKWIRVVESLTGAKDIHFASVDKQTSTRVDEGIFVDIRKNTNRFATRKYLLCTHLQFESSIFIKVTQHDSQQEQEAVAFVYFDGVP